MINYIPLSLNALIPGELAPCTALSQGLKMSVLVLVHGPITYISKFRKSLYVLKEDPRAWYANKDTLMIYIYIYHQCILIHIPSSWILLQNYI